MNGDPMAASRTWLEVPRCNEMQFDLLMTDPGTDKIYGEIVQRGTPEVTMEFVGDLPTTREVVFPKERFVTYEKSDESWAVPLGFAKVQKRPIRQDDVVSITHIGYRMDCQVTFVGPQQNSCELLRWLVKCIVVNVVH